MNQIEKVVEKPKSGGQGQVATQAWLHQAQKSWTPKAPPASGEGPQGRQQHVRPRRLPAPTTPTSGHGTWLPAPGSRAGLSSLALRASAATLGFEDHPWGRSHTAVGAEARPPSATRGEGNQSSGSPGASWLRFGRPQPGRTPRGEAEPRGDSRLPFCSVIPSGSLSCHPVLPPDPDTPGTSQDLSP